MAVLPADQLIRKLLLKHIVPLITPVEKFIRFNDLSSIWTTLHPFWMNFATVISESNKCCEYCGPQYLQWSVYCSLALGVGRFAVGSTFWSERGNEDGRVGASFKTVAGICSDNSVFCFYGSLNFHCALFWNWQSSYLVSCKLCIISMIIISSAQWSLL